MKFSYTIVLVFIISQIIFSSDKIVNTSDFIKTKTLLMKVISDNNSSEEKKVEALIQLAEGYEELAEFHKMAKSFYKKVLKNKLPDGNNYKQKAKLAIERIESMENKYKDLNKYLHKLRIISSKKRNNDEVIKSISEIKKTIENNPDYYNINELKFYLAKENINIKKYRKANELFLQIINNKPYINLKIPVKTTATANYENLINERIGNFIKYSFFFLILISIVLFYISKPWKWLSWKHLLGYLIMLLLWFIVYKFLLIIFEKDFTSNTEFIENIQAEYPAYISSTVDSYALPMVKSFFNYGMILVTGVFIFSLAIYRNKFRKISIFANIMFTTLLSITLITTFYAREIRDESIFYTESNNLMKYFYGNYFFRVPNMEAYILTDPGKYPKVNYRHIRRKVKEKELREWIKDNVPKERNEED